MRFLICPLTFSQELEVRRRFLCPSGRFSSAQAASLGLAFSVVFYEFLETLLGMGAIVGIENYFDGRGDLTFQMLLGDVFLGVFLEGELASLPGSGVERGF